MVGIDDMWTDRVVAGIAETGKPVVGLALEGTGDLRTIERGARQAARMLQDASEQPRVPVALDEVMVSMKCGESDPTSGLAACPATGQFVDRHVEAGGTVIFGETTELTGGEDLIAARCIDDDVRRRFLGFYERYLAFIQSTGANVFGSQPTEGNVRGGITTIEEKAMGNIAKTGTAPVVDALEPAQPPSRVGLQFMDTPSASSECLTLMGAAGSVLHLFPTGQGNVIGNAIQPVIKVTANPDTVAAMPEHIDLDVSGLLQLEYSLAEAGDRLADVVAATINGRLTATEVLGHREFDFTKLYRSA